jgi:prevent-host-death family protein
MECTFDMYMKRVSIKEAREKLRVLVDEARAGQEITLLRRGQEVARLVSPGAKRKRLPTLRQFRSSIRRKGASLSAEILRQRRQERS